MPKYDITLEEIKEKNQEIEKNFSKLDEWFIPRDRPAFYLTNDFHPYFAAFPPELVGRILDRYSKEGDLVLDPFVGGGSSAVECVLRNRKFVGIDISELAVLISKVKSTPINISLNKVNTFLKRVKNEVENAKTYKAPSNDIIKDWFDHNTALVLSTIIYNIDKEKDAAVKDFYRIAFSSIVRKASKAKNAEQHLCKKKGKKIPNALELFGNKLRQMVPLMNEFYNKTKKNYKSVLQLGDVRKLDELAKENSVDLIITSPPYGTGSKYTSIYALSFGWLNLKKPSLKESLEKNRDFSEQLKIAIGKMYKVLKKNKYCCIVYGDPTTEESLTYKAIEDAKEAGFKYEGLISCPIEKTLSNHHQKYRRFIPKDFILIFRK